LRLAKLHHHYALILVAANRADSPRLSASGKSRCNKTIALDELTESAREVAGEKVKNKYRFLPKYHKNR
jgi:hypothetical protein